MDQQTGQFRIFTSRSAEPRSLRQDRILIGRLETCDIVLDDRSVSRVHAGVTFGDGRYRLANLSTANLVTLNGRRLGPKDSDVLTDGDTIQVGPFAIEVAGTDETISLTIVEAVVPTALPPDKDDTATPDTPQSPQSAAANAGNVLQVFWDKRTRQKEDWGSRLRPTEKPRPGKAMFNWRPTGDLRQTWRAGLFIWAFLIVGAIGVLAFYKYPNAYAPLPLAAVHADVFATTRIAADQNANSCTTCHTANQPVENACIKCHQATEFHSSNTRAHEEAGITCTVCHREHQGPEADLGAQARASCSECHNDNNPATYNGKAVRTAHDGSYGYPTENGVWKWKGVYSDVAAAIPEIGSSATGDPDEQAKLSRQFHTIHVARLKAPAGFPADSRGLVSCSTCHKTFDPVDRVTPRETCAACHMSSSTSTSTSSSSLSSSSSSSSRSTGERTADINCISCHVQHPFSTGRWKEFLTEDAARRRHEAVVTRIGELGSR